MFLRPCEGVITSRFQPARLDPVHKKDIRPHVGTDFAKSGTVPIHATLDGKVTLARQKDSDGFGYVVFIEHFNSKGAVEFTSVYAHLSKVVAKLGPVKKGALIGYMGNTGNSTGQHLHFELHKGKRFSDNRNAVDAMMYLPLEVALKLGDKGPNVKAMQLFLVRQGYLKVADGVFGALTETAVKKCQTDHKMTPDGIAGAKTMEMLKKDKQPIKNTAAAKNKEGDEMSQTLPMTQQDDMRKLLKRAHTDKVLSVDHSPKVAKMTRGEALDLLISYNARKK